MPRHALCAAVLASLLIAACGGSGHSASSSSSTSSPTSSASTATSANTATTTATSTVSAGPTTTTATTSSRPPEVPKNKAPKHSRPTAPNTNVRIPAAFVIRAGGAVTPPLISAPANVTIELQLHNQDAKAHRVTLSVPHFASISVPAGASKTTDVTGAPKGTYRLLVDGAPKARVVVGAVPGP
jgi:peptidoglycan DL-endopeptidase CwlO